jgi:hypothetical protein
VHEHILAAVIRLDEPETLLAVEPLHGALCHVVDSQRKVFGGAVALPFRGRDFGEKPLVRHAVRGKAKSFGRNSMFLIRQYGGK